VPITRQIILLYSDVYKLWSLCNL